MVNEAAKDPKANLIIMGDFNEGFAPKHPEQSLAVLFKAVPPMVDTFDFLTGRAATHANGAAYDRILVSDAVVKGLSGLRFESVAIQKHSEGKGGAEALHGSFAVALSLTPRLHSGAESSCQWNAEAYCACRNEFREDVATISGNRQKKPAGMPTRKV